MLCGPGKIGMPAIRNGLIADYLRGLRTVAMCQQRIDAARVRAFA
jgi:hypothetical protein